MQGVGGTGASVCLAQGGIQGSPSSGLTPTSYL